MSVIEVFTSKMLGVPGILLSFLVLAVLIPPAAYSQLARAAVEKPDFKVLRKGNDYEIRRYPACIVARVTVKEDPSEAMSDGFGPLAGFIFGANQPNAKIAMTSPVTMEGKGEKIAMTSPVTMNAEEGGGEEWIVSFIMPSAYTLETLPQPTNDRVVLKELPARTLAVHRFGWTGAHHHMVAHEKTLREKLAEDGIEVTGDAVYARYDPPWTVPLFRRNEVMLPVAFEGGEATE